MGRFQISSSLSTQLTSLNQSMTLHRLRGTLVCSKLRLVSQYLPMVKIPSLRVETVFEIVSSVVSLFRVPTYE